MPPSLYQRAKLLLGRWPSLQPRAPLLPPLNCYNLSLCTRLTLAEREEDHSPCWSCLGLVLFPLSLLPACLSQGSLEGPPHQLMHLRSANVTAIGFP